MNSNKITIKQVGYTYVFRVVPMSRETVEELRDNIRQQLKEGLVVLPAYVTLESVEPHLETFIE